MGFKWQLYKCLLFCLMMFRPNKMIVQSQSGTGKTASTLLSMDKSNAATKHLPPVLFRFISCMFLPPAQPVKKNLTDLLRCVQKCER